MSVRLIDQDEHYGEMGWGSMAQSGANTFSSALIDAIIEPDFIVSRNSKKGMLGIDIEDVLVWDIRKWLARTTNAADITGGEDSFHQLQGGITKDNTGNASSGPAAANVANGVFPSGVGAAVVGTAGVTGSARTVGDEIMPYVAYFEYGLASVEQQDASGQIVIPAQRVPKNDQAYSPYQANGVEVHNLLTAAHYWMWLDTQTQGGAATQSVGGEVRRVSIDLEELMFDRETIITLLDALEVISG